MPRPRKVSRQEALEAAMQLFWAQGYKATSVDQLQKVMGLQRGSFYLHFKDKKSLFLEVLDIYKQNIVISRRKLVEEANTVQQGLELFFQTLIEHSIKNKKRAGCLNTNTSSEMGLLDDEISEKLGLGIKSWESFWIEILKKGQRTGELSKKIDVVSCARLIVATTQGINVIVKVNPDSKFLNGAVKACLEILLK